MMFSTIEPNESLKYTLRCHELRTQLYTLILTRILVEHNYTWFEKCLEYFIIGRTSVKNAIMILVSWHNEHEHMISNKNSINRTFSLNTINILSAFTFNVDIHETFDIPRWSKNILPHFNRILLQYHTFLTIKTHISFPELTFRNWIEEDKTIRENVELEENFRWGPRV